jgi:prepilin-type N-terminal cleavage/methylation domain-containing protein/prepilin-type processing-associated H-X9-DG protein
MNNFVESAPKIRSRNTLFHPLRVTRWRHEQLRGKPVIANRKLQIHGFTLVELLVVIGIITVLIGILIPALSAAKKQASRIKCASNMRQVSLAIINYTTDNKGRFPIPGNIVGQSWVHWGNDPERKPNDGKIVPYIGGTFKLDLFLCPADSRIRNTGWNYPYSYTINTHLFSLGDGFHSRRISSIRRSSDKIMLVDESEMTIGVDRWQPTVDLIRAVGGVPSLRHTQFKDQKGVILPERCNIGFVDGHVDFVLQSMTFQESSYYPWEN